MPEDLRTVEQRRRARIETITSLVLELRHWRTALDERINELEVEYDRHTGLLPENQAKPRPDYDPRADHPERYTDEPI